MGTIGDGYGSEWHLLRWIEQHQTDLNARIATTLGLPDGTCIKWLSCPVEPGGQQTRKEWKGLEFIEDPPLQSEWKKFWPQSGNVQNWDAVGRAGIEGSDVWLLVEAKSHLDELNTRCGAQEHGGLPQIRDALEETKRAFGVDLSREWLSPFYQYANRLAVLHFLGSHGVAAKVIFVYFLGDKFPECDRVCPFTEAEWDKKLQEVESHLGLSGQSALEAHVHRIFLPVCPQTPGQES